MILHCPALEVTIFTAGQEKMVELKYAMNILGNSQIITLSINYIM